MSEYKLRALRLLRRREEEQALAALGSAIRARTQAEAQEERWQEQVRLARLDLTAATKAARAGGATGQKPGARAPAPRHAATVLGEARFVARRQSELARAEASLAAFRQDTLAKARAAEEAARAHHQTARAAREDLDRHEAQMQATLRRVAERRAEMALDDQPVASTIESRRR